MSEVDASTQHKLGGLIKGILGGTVDLGITTLPLLAAYKKAKHDPEWREVGFQTWLEEDPNAAEMLVRVFQKTQETIPKNARDRLILALGGIPGDA